ncbi:MAG: hypothetical protein RLZZ241_772 [Bacteroidota bacterium]
MKGPLKLLLMAIFAFAFQCGFAQDRPARPRVKSDSLRAEFKPNIKTADGPKITIADYKIISFKRDTTILDTTLNIYKEYKYNYLRKDDFELMPFSNVGQPYNRLGVQLSKRSLYPQLGARARHFNYIEVEEIPYYNVATPLTDLFFKTTLEQGQLLDATLASNFSRRLNVSIAFKGFRSRGKYAREEVQSGNFRMTSNYITENGRYQFRAHVAAQDIKGQENGGIAYPELQFESNNPEFSDRSRMDVKLKNAQNELQGKRYYLDQKYRLLRGMRDSLPGKGGLYLTHRYTYESKWYQYTQNTDVTPYFGPLLYGESKDQAYLKTTYNQLGAEWNNALLGRLEAFISAYDYRYFFTSILETDTGVIPSELSGQQIMAGGSWDKEYAGYKLSADGAFGVSGDLTQSQLNAAISLPLDSKFKLDAGVHQSSRLPDFNFLLYQSDYLNYNWFNTSQLNSEQVSGVFANLKSELLGDVHGSINTVNNYTYFASLASPEQIEAGLERQLVLPRQQSNPLNVLRLKFMKEFRFGKWALNNTILYQHVGQKEQVLNLPTLLTRNTLYYSSDVFKKAMFIQTGVTLKYFTAYYADAYHPLLADFYIQNQQRIGDFPLLDAFINARVRQTRIYLKAEHLNSSFSKTKYYSALNYPYRDFVIRFGLVWNFFS